MNRQEKIVVALLFLAILGWSYFNRQNMAKQQELAAEAQAAATNQVQTVATSDVPTAPASGIGDLPTKIEMPPAVEHQEEEKIVELSDDILNIAISSWGGGIKSAQLKDYDAGSGTNTAPVILDFSDNPALSLSGIPGLSGGTDFDVKLADSEVIVSQTTAEGLSFKRVVKIDGSYRVTITDEFVNQSDSSMDLGDNSIQLGVMRKDLSRAAGRKGMVYLDVNSLSADGTDQLIYWDVKPPKDQDKLSKRFHEGVGGGGFAIFGSRLLKQLPAEIPPVSWNEPTEWVALKNRFFIQTLIPGVESSGYVINAKRVVAETEDPALPKTWSKTAVIGELGATMNFAGVTLDPGKPLVREMQYYVGPQKYDYLKEMGHYQERTIFRTWRGFGWFRGVCVGLLKTMNIIHSVIPNYGVAIILLTILVKILFWPIMQKSTASMKKMQDLKPQLDVLKEKYSKNPQKMQQEQMALYKKHGVNPMASCLPMLIQMPVFIAMFTVIRKSVELRGAGFLWISDLSAPELLFADVLPMPLNILPLLMCITMFLQQKMTPSTGDAQQKQMMMMMPVMMLFFLYNMASGLTLYWTVSQLLSIAQLHVQNKKK